MLLSCNYHGSVALVVMIADLSRSARVPLRRVALVTAVMALAWGCGNQNDVATTPVSTPAVTSVDTPPPSTDTAAPPESAPNKSVGLVLPAKTGPFDDAERQGVDLVNAAITERDLDRAETQVNALLADRIADPYLESLQAAIAAYRVQLDTAEPWTGPVPHLFIHSLIVDTNLAFDGEYTETGYREYMITATEFRRMIEQMNAAGYTLIDIHDLYHEEPDGTVVADTPMVPPGRKPFILSIDDVSYYDYMVGDGFAERLQLDANNRVVTRVLDAGGNDLNIPDGDAIPILDDYVLAHPEFSFVGAKGIIALTGYEGLLGYDVSRDQVDQPDYPQRVADATVVADHLKQTGWLFADHSYTHAEDLKTGTMDQGRFEFDCENWLKEIGSVVGPTDLYISPFGYSLPNTDSRYRYLIEKAGFNVFAPISDGVSMTWNGDNVVMQRLAVDGFTLANRGPELAPYFDAATVWDEARGPRPA